MMMPMIQPASLAASFGQIAETQLESTETPRQRPLEEEHLHKDKSR
jgi:hypothetical protein